MANGILVLTDGGIFSRIRELLSEAKKRAVLVAPYVAPNDDLVRLIKGAVRRGVPAEIWFRADKLNEYVRLEWFQELASAGVRFRTVEKLHAKVYVFDTTFVVSSMNLTEPSWNDSREIGFVLPQGDRSCAQIVSYLKDLEHDARDVEGTSSRSGYSAPRSESRRRAEDGFCIRCSIEIPFDKRRPYCAEHFATWAKYRDEDYEDEFCHQCGEPEGASMRRPLCDDCYFEN